MALAHGQSPHSVLQVVLAVAYLVRYNYMSHSPLVSCTLITGTGEQIIRTALARDLCERANPNHCEDAIGSIERSFGRFSGMQVRHHRPSPDKPPQNPARQGKRKGLLAPLSS